MAEHDNVDAVAFSPVIPAEAAKEEAWEPRGDARQSGKRLLASSSRTPRASGMTPCALLT
jgi:hypothetical protein